MQLELPFFQDSIPTHPNGYEDVRYVKTCEDIRNALSGEGIGMSRIYTARSDVNPKHWNRDFFDYGGEIPLELQRPNFAWDGDKDDIISQIDRGVLFALHRDHGSPAGWGHPSFTITDLDGLKNGDLTPVVFSLNCESGAYQLGKEESLCFAEKFLSMKGGAVGVFAASAISKSGYNDALAFEMFRCIWPDADFPSSFRSYDHPDGETNSQTATLGAILKRGVDRMAQYYSYAGDENHLLTKKIFHCFGDPSMRMYSREPQTVMSSVSSSGKTSAGQEIRFTFGKPVNMSAVYRNGTVKVASGTQITLAFSNLDVPEVTVFGQDIRTSCQDSHIKNLMEATETGIESVSQDGETLRIKIRKPEHSSAMISLKSLDGNYSVTKEAGSGTNVEFEVAGLYKGIYTVTLSVDGMNIETTKTILK